jgi:hypothetical protein
MLHRICIALGLVMFATTLALADKAPAPPRLADKASQKTTAPVKVVRADLAKEGKGVAAKVQIPQKVLAGMALKGARAEEKQSSLPWWSTVVAGLAMSVGAVGLLVAARGNHAARVAAIAALMLATLAGGYALADLRIPDDIRKPAAESVVIEIVEDGDAVVITLPGK